ncbi:hypothetical protein BSKO_06808 [Bryopsis sp. KO-2023]|nr:hypothetical protein BSKO_06808 [Bryopsis sp. KO-2023]
MNRAMFWGLQRGEHVCKSMSMLESRLSRHFGSALRLPNATHRLRSRGTGATTARPRAFCRPVQPLLQRCLQQSPLNRVQFRTYASVATPETEEMSKSTTTYRKDYKPTPYLVNDYHLSFNLNEDSTRVATKIRFVPNYSGTTPPPLVLDGRNDVSLVSVKVAGTELAKDKYTVTPKLLTIEGLPAGEFDVEIEVDIKPQENTSLEGLYKSSGNYCTQCEAEGFRGITYYYDRPDVMAMYTVRIEAEKAKYPTLLSNGNLESQGDLDGGRHYAVWVDPFRKPCYLFALVAGDFAMQEDTFKTMSGKDVALRIFTERHNISKVGHAMNSLQQAMKWDEEKFGREYDLDLFNIVAVDDFNMGAMENKSLNVFNTRCVLASPDTATDSDFLAVQGVVAHEYFHNWTGNRVTCRDWFQLTLKEGLTVFRDQQFSSDMNSRPVKRISDATFMRAGQFTEDAGPMAHPIRPDSYMKMDNFYTGTVYRKGATIIGLYQTILGVDGFRKGMDLYFERHDGQAVTCDDFLAAMADANGKDLSSLAKWYSQAGTPALDISTVYDPEAKTYTLTAKQKTPPTPGQTEKVPVLIPISVGLLGADGKDMPVEVRGGAKVTGTTAVLEFDTEEATFVFENVAEKPVPSILRDFSAPVKLTVEGQTDEDLVFLFANDSDQFNRWDAGQKLSKKTIIDLYNAAIASSEGTVKDRCAAAGGVPQKLVDAFKSVFLDTSIDGAFSSLATGIPPQSELYQTIQNADPVVLHEVRIFIQKSIAEQLESELEVVLKDNSSPPDEEYKVDPKSVGKRALKNRALAYLSSLNKPKYNEECLKRCREATNMTDAIAALGALSSVPCDERKTALEEFGEKWKDDKLVLLKWLSVQCMSNIPGNLAEVEKLESHPGYTITNPNCNYTLLGGFAGSAINFHNIDGSGYKWMSDRILKIDAINPGCASRLCNAVMSKWRQFDTVRQDLMKKELQKMLAEEKLSENTFEIVSKSLE